MLALVCDDPPRLERDRPVPRRLPGESLLRVRVAGICDTDLQLARGYMNFRGVLGHEFVGEVAESDDATLVGARVVADINAGCGRCADCLERDGHHCERRTVLGILGRDGALAEHVVLPDGCLVRVPDSVPDAKAVFTEPLAAALHVLDDAPASDGPTAILGDGKLGLLVALALRSAGREVLVVGHHEAKLALARAAGADTVLERDLGEARRGFAAVVEATGSARGLSRALELTRPRGTVVMKTTVAVPAGVDLSPIVVNELRVLGSRCGNPGRAVEALSQGLVDPSPLITARYPLAEAEAALRHAATPGTLKVLVEA